VATRSWTRRTGTSAAQLVSALAGRAASDETVGWIRRHLDILRIAGAAVAALALLIFGVNWAGLLIIAALLALYEYGLHRLRQLPPTEPSGIPLSPALASAGSAPDATAGPLTPAGPDGRPSPAADTSHDGHTAR
jgi:hypothetical protein